MDSQRAAAIDFHRNGNTNALLKTGAARAINTRAQYALSMAV